MKKIKFALLSLSNKNNLRDILKTLKRFKIKIISSGGTYKEIKKLGFKCTEISKFTNSPEILDGRVKTLHPKIHAGIMNKRKNKSHQSQLKKNNYESIDLVIVNFYPFEETLNNTKNHSKIIENIDIGGPTMVRAAAKNYNDVTVITSVKQYKQLNNELNLHKGSTSLSFRKKMSEEAFSETAYYDSLISNYFNEISNNQFPQKKVFSGKIFEKLRYGENPHQESAIYLRNNCPNFKQLHGKKLSYNNYNDIFSAITISKSLPKNVGTVIIKHNNPCGVSIHNNHLKSYQLALASDPISAFGGIISFNFKITEKIALELNKIFLEVVIAKGFNSKAIKILKKRKNLRIIDSSNLTKKNLYNYISSFNSILIQSPDNQIFTKKNFKVVSKIKPSSKTFKDLIFAFNICRFVKSNAIVIAKNCSSIGIGAGQSSRIDSCKIAIEKMEKSNSLENENIVAASDAFFPFVDGIEKLVQSGVSAIVQPSGSIRDKEIIKYANQTKTILVFSKTRHFKH